MNKINHPKTPSDRRIKKLLRKHLFGRNIFCPECRSYRVVRHEERYRCRNCKCRFSLLSHTWLAHCRLPLTKLWEVIWCFINRIPVKQAQSFTELSEKAVRHWYDTLRTQLPKEQKQLDGVVQIDEVYMGGWGGRAIIAAKSTLKGTIVMEVLPSYEVSRPQIIDFITEYVKPYSLVQTDGSPLYARIESYCRVYHRRDIHKKFEFHLTSEIEGLFGVLRTFIRRMYHHVTKDKLPEYVHEFCVRFSRKEYFISPHQFLLKTLRLVTLR